MKQTTADAIKAGATRSLLTCHCGHPQWSHLHQMKDGWRVGLWKECLEDGCRCLGFVSCLNAGDKRDIDRELDRRVESSRLAAILQDQPLGPVPNRRAQFPMAKANRKLKKGDPKERVKSANDAPVSPLYHQAPVKRKDSDKYAWEE